MTALQPYPAYRDSGAEWLGEVPEHWDVRRARYVFGEVDRRSRDGSERHLSMSQKLGLVPSHLVENRTLVSENYAGGKLCKVGDLVLNRLKAHLGVFALAHHEGIVSPDYTVLRLKAPGRAEFFEQALRSSCCRIELRIRAKGIVEGFWRLYTDDLNQIRIPVPPDAEQAAIVRFLDHANRRIRRYIRAKERLIKLLEEQKQAVIHQAVTGRINVRTGQPYPAYKESGVEWLRAVPEHWELSRVKTEFHCLNRHRVPLSGTQRGAMKRREFDYYGASGVIDKIDNYLFDDELLLIAEDGANLVLRNLPLAIVARGRFWVNNHAHILKPKRGHIDFLAHVMEGLNYSPWISGAAQPKLTQDRIMSIVIAVPSRHEQAHIVGCLGEVTIEIDATLRRTRRQIALLREYRTRLIADVVTGKLDVRGAAAELPSQDDFVAGHSGIAAENRADPTNPHAEQA